MDIKIVNTCPLGSTCRKLVINEKTKEQEEHVCRWYIRVAGENPTTGEKVDQSDCAIAFMPMMLHENSKHQLNTTTAVDDLKNKVATSNDVNTHILMAITNVVSQQEQGLQDLKNQPLISNLQV